MTKTKPAGPWSLAGFVPAEAFRLLRFKHRGDVALETEMAHHDASHALASRLLQTSTWSQLGALLVVAAGWSPAVVGATANLRNTPQVTNRSEPAAGGSLASPWALGPLRVGVTTKVVRDQRRDGSELTVELWYPAAGATAGEDAIDFGELGVGTQPATRDAAPAEGRFPLVLLSHGYMGDRRQLAYLACHIASRGYVVAAPDHEHLTRYHVQLLALHQALAARSYDITQSLRRVIWQHPCELSEIRRALAAHEVGRLGAHTQTDNVAVGGFCLGAWIAMKAVARGLVEPRAVVLMAPMGTHEGALAGELADEPVRDWAGPETLLIAAEVDSVIPLPHLEALADELPAPRRFAVLRNADHLQLSHLGDADQQWLATHARAKTFFSPTSAPRGPDELAPTRAVHDAVCALAVAQIEASCRDDARARRFLDDPVDALARQNVLVDWRATSEADAQGPTRQSP